MTVKAKRSGGGDEPATKAADAAAEGGSPAPRRQGRRLVIDLQELEDLAALQGTIAEAAAWFGVSPSTQRRRLKEAPYREAWRRGTGKGRLGLRRAQLSLAEKNATMAIFLGKQILGQDEGRAKPHADSADGKAADDRSARDEIARRIAGIASRGGAPGDPERPDGEGSG